MNTLASSIRAQRRSSLDESSRNLNGHTSSVQRSHTDADVLHALGGDVGSSGLQRCPAGMVVSYVLLASSRRNSMEWGCLHDARSDGVDSDASGRLLLRERACESDDGALGGRVVDLGRVALVAEDGSAVDNVVAAFHVLKSVLAQPDHLDDVGLESLSDGREVDFPVVGARDLHGSVVDEHVDLAEDLDVLVDGFLVVLLDAQVVGHAVSFAAGFLDLCDGVLCVDLLLGEVED
jgi:hypothetical protein